MKNRNEVIIEFVECDMEEADVFMNDKPFKAVIKNGNRTQT